jgi:hypothetical protein
MTFSQAVLRALLAFVGFVVIQIITGMLVPMKPVALPHIFLWMLLSNAVVVAALSIVAVRTEWRGWKMGAAVASIPLTIASVNLLEASVFLKDAPLGFGKIFLYTLISSALSVSLWMLLFGKRDDGLPIEHYRPILAKSGAKEPGNS